MKAEYIRRIERLEKIVVADAAGPDGIFVVCLDASADGPVETPVDGWSDMLTGNRTMRQPGEDDETLQARAIAGSAATKRTPGSAPVFFSLDERDIKDLEATR